MIDYRFLWILAEVFIVNCSILLVSYLFVTLFVALVDMDI